MFKKNKILNTRWKTTTSTSTPYVIQHDFVVRTKLGTMRDATNETNYRFIYALWLHECTMLCTVQSVNKKKMQNMHFVNILLNMLLWN